MSKIFFSKKETLKNDFENPSGLSPILAVPSFSPSMAPLPLGFSQPHIRALSDFSALSAIQETLKTARPALTIGGKGGRCAEKA